MFSTYKLQNVANWPIELIKCYVAVECFLNISLNMPDMSIVVSWDGCADLCLAPLLYIQKKEMALIHLLLKFCCSILPHAESMSPPQWLVSY